MIVSEIWKLFKAVAYGIEHIGAVVYIDLGGYNFCSELGSAIVFSGVSLGCSSSINSAEEIIIKILQQEDLSSISRIFYDLQTFKGYRHYKKGQFVLNKLTIQVEGEGIIVKSWDEISKVSEEFKAIFKPIIGFGDPLMEKFIDSRN